MSYTTDISFFLLLLPKNKRLISRTPQPSQTLFSAESHPATTFSPKAAPPLWLLSPAGHYPVISSSRLCFTPSSLLSELLRIHSKPLANVKLDILSTKKLQLLLLACHPRLREAATLTYRMSSSFLLRFEIRAMPAHLIVLLPLC